jgi:hypothetical protein
MGISFQGLATRTLRKAPHYATVGILPTTVRGFGLQLGSEVGSNQSWVPVTYEGFGRAAGI